MNIKITAYNAICNIGINIEEIFSNAIKGVSDRFVTDKKTIKGTTLRLGKINFAMPEIKEARYNLRCNQIALYCCDLEKENIKKILEKYGNENIAIVCATTNSGVEEYEKTKNPHHCEIGNPAKFLQEYFKLKNYCASVSTACSSGIKAFSLAKNLLNSKICEAVIVVGVDSLAKVPLFGFNSLEILSSNPTIPFSKNRSGINIGEGGAIFILEKDVKNGIEIAGIGETTDTFHATTPEPNGKEAIKSIEIALKKSNISAQNVDYINLHGTGTVANDLMEANAVFKIFGKNTPASSTKPLTGHCLGAASSLESALCCRLLEQNNRKIYPHISDMNYDENLPKINLARKDLQLKNLKTVLNLSFGFGGTNTAMVLRRCDE